MSTLLPRIKRKQTTLSAKLISKYQKHGQYINVDKKMEWKAITVIKKWKSMWNRETACRRVKKLNRVTNLPASRIAWKIIAWKIH